MKDPGTIIRLNFRGWALEISVLSSPTFSRIAKTALFWRTLVFSNPHVELQRFVFGWQGLYPRCFTTPQVRTCFEYWTSNGMICASCYALPGKGRKSRQYWWSYARHWPSQRYLNWYDNQSVCIKMYWVDFDQWNAYCVLHYRRQWQEKSNIPWQGFHKSNVTFLLQPDETGWLQDIAWTTSILPSHKRSPILLCQTRRRCRKEIVTPAKLKRCFSWFKQCLHS